MPFEIDTGSWAMFYGKPNGLRSINRWRVFPFPWNPGGFGGSPPNPHINRVRQNAFNWSI